MDADLRALERAARTDPDARLRYADALERIGEVDAALEALRPLFLRCDGFEAGARVRAGLILAARGDVNARYHLSYRFAREDVIVDAEYRTLAPRLLALIEREGPIEKLDKWSTTSVAYPAYVFFATYFPVEVVREHWARAPMLIRTELASMTWKASPPRARALADVEPDERVRRYLETGEWPETRDAF